ncbi:MAG TPA: VacJ family lipoprotein [Gammaproteobacteria bacterium]|nr:VacJ family lipoprotein [Gammaproteobacteria bacterium]
MKQFLISVLLFFTLNVTAAENIDPLEDVNRVTHEFNEVFDDNIFEPISRAYKNYIPDFVQECVSNFFDNLRDVSTLGNQILQFKPIESITTLGRILVNSTVGLGGLFDVASNIDLTTENEDFGQTMAVWGMETGPYVTLPFLGPSTLRDSIGIFVDTNSPTKLINEMDDIGFVSASAMNAIDQRVELLPIMDLLDHSDDLYIAMRSSYLQKRKYDVFDGDLPIEEDDEF